MIWNWFPALAAVHLSLSAAGAALAATRWRKSSPVLLGGAAVLLSGFLAAVWIDMERPPLRTYGETRLVYAAGAGILSVALWVGVRQVWTLLFGAVVSALFVALTLALPESHTRELLPALRSPWFVPHVVVYLFGYAVSTAASLAAFLDSRRPIPNGRKLDTTLSVSVVLLTWGLLFGALWAKEAWGSYWTWDPKETWAFLTWAGYMGVLHWRRARPQDPLAGTRFLAAWWIVLMLAWFAVASLPAGANSVHTYAQ